MTSPTPDQSRLLLAGLSNCIRAALDQPTVDLLTACREHLRAALDREAALTAEVDAARAEVGRLREALEWYADPELYAPHPHGIAFDRHDKSYVARAALVNGGEQ